jgi:aminoglycoside phosphotransferase (APT) family kinase protein
MIASPTLPQSVAVHLLDYLQDRLAVADLRYVEKPSQVPDGWETYIYRFQLGNSRGLPTRFTRPLILRAYASPDGLPRLRHEYAAQEYMRRQGYPVARPLVLEEDSELFGGPFMIMEQLPGVTLLELMLRRPWRIIGGPAQLADAHARLHRLPVGDFPRPARPLLCRSLEEMRAAIRAHALRGLMPGLDWLHAHRPEPPAEPRILHLDFHPANLIFHEDRCRGVLDWCESDVGDPHADVAATLVLIRSAPVEVPTLRQRLSLWPGRFLLRRWYLRAYRRRLPLDKGKLAYHVAWAALRRLCRWGMYLDAGPEVMGCKASSMRHLSAYRVGVLRRCFCDWAGVAVRL